MQMNCAPKLYKRRMVFFVWHVYDRGRFVCEHWKCIAFTWYWHKRKTTFISKLRLKMYKIIFDSEEIDSFWQRDRYKWHSAILCHLIQTNRCIFIVLCKFKENAYNAMRSVLLCCKKRESDTHINTKQCPVLHRNKRSWERTNVTHRSSCRMVVFNSRPDNARLPPENNKIYCLSFYVHTAQHIDIAPLSFLSCIFYWNVYFSASKCTVYIRSVGLCWSPMSSPITSIMIICAHWPNKTSIGSCQISSNTLRKK